MRPTHAGSTSDIEICGDRERELRPIHPNGPRSGLAAIGRHDDEAEILGMKFSRLIAWRLWPCIYLGKLPGLQKKAQVAIDWALDLAFSKDLVRLPTLGPLVLSEEE